ncbi:30S ribosomal protein S24e [ANME-1 cluster archaeon ex4572_4]|nr:hypothetical protein [Methanophagales archaeon]OYT67073.1 MAG: 30S ribosomal protein S24e [ANME-1 cluster archaeon ex4572_4]PXF50897.1 MAG: 30S ribosomal protein S24e [Methanophagales archaeon]
MEIEITEDRENQLLRRKEVFFRLKHGEGAAGKGEKSAKGEGKGATPSREETRAVLIKKLRCSPNLLVIERMRTKFGRQETVGYAKVYEREDRLREIEREHILKRNFGGAS